MKTLLLAGVFAVGCLSFVGCNAADNAVDCKSICDRYKTCFDKSYDSGACQDRCRDDADTEGYATQADECDSCIDGKSCTGAVFTCSSECGGIVP